MQEGRSARATSHAPSSQAASSVARSSVTRSSQRAFNCSAELGTDLKETACALSSSASFSRRNACQCKVRITGVSGQGTAATVMANSGKRVALICCSMRSSNSMLVLLVQHAHRNIPSRARCFNSSAFFAPSNAHGRDFRKRPHVPKKSFPHLHLRSRPGAAVSTRGQGLPSRWCKLAPSRCNVRVPARGRAVECTTMRISFLGAAREVTGSCFLVDAGSLRFLVDCGMFQGGHEALTKNRSALDFDVSALDFMLLTHAHIDHSGLIPRLVHKGFRGPVYCTAATADLLAVMLTDSANIQEKDAQRERRKPLYTVDPGTAQPAPTRAGQLRSGVCARGGRARASAGCRTHTRARP